MMDIRRLNISMTLKVIAGTMILMSFITIETGSDDLRLDEPVVAGGMFKEIVDGVVFDMIYVEGGTFQMGDSADEDNPVHKVVLDSYYILSTEVTQEMWETVMAGTDRENIYVLRNEEMEIIEARGGDKCELLPVPEVGPDYPMYYVRLTDAKEFCRRLSAITGRRFALPTDAQWEYAARGGKAREQTPYSGSSDIGEVAWYEGNSGGRMHKVGALQPNALGLYDMSGNVREWCADNYNYNRNTSAPQHNPLYQSEQPSPYYVSRGGAWNSDAYECKVSCRIDEHYAFGGTDMGFRIVCNLNEN